VASLDFQEQFGWDNIRNRVNENSAYLIFLAKESWSKIIDSGN